VNGLVYSASLVAAFLGGILALFAPCCIVTLVPNFVGASLRRGLRALPTTALLFSAGLSIVLLPIVLGVGALGQSIRRFHGPVFVVVGVFLLLLGIYVLSGRRWMLPLQMPRLRRAGAGGGTSTFFLGVASGVASSCCAPVVAGVVAMSALNGTVAGSLGLGLAYVFGMIFPLLLFALGAARRGERTARARTPRRIRIAGRSVVWSDAVSGVMFALVGVVTFLLGVSGRESFTPGPLAAWDRWITAKFGDVAVFLGGAPVIVQAAMLLAVAAAVAFPLWRAVHRPEVTTSSREKEMGSEPGGDLRPTSAVDPVCGMTTEVTRTTATVQLNGATHYFCAPGCAQRFREDPDRFLASPVSTPA